VAKKVRTPPPPRRVQAPKVRTGRERDRATRGVRSLRDGINPLYAGLALAAVVVAVVLIVVFATRGGGGNPEPARINAAVSLGDMTKLPGIQLGKPPWNRGGAKLSQRLAALGLSPAASEQLAFHIHQHLDVYANGNHVDVPPNIGFEIQGQSVTGLAFLHTHDASGIIHVESPTEYDYTLGQFFGVWGVRLSRTCVGGLCGSRPLKVWVNGVPFVGDPTQLVLTEHEEIALAYGAPPAKIPSHYSFPAGY
jgi:hypothetical protein